MLKTLSVLFLAVPFSLTAGASTQATNYHCTLKGNYVSPWGKPSQVNTSMVLSPDEYHHKDDDKIDASLDYHMDMVKGHMTPVAVQATISGPGANNILSGSIVVQNIPFLADGSLPRSFEVETHQDLDGTCVHVANKKQFLCSYGFETTDTLGNSVMTKKFNNTLIDMGYYSSRGIPEPAPFSQGISSLPSDARGLDANEYPKPFVTLDNVRGDSSLCITAGVDKNVGVFGLNAASDAVQGFSSHYKTVLRCER